MEEVQKQRIHEPQSKPQLEAYVAGVREDAEDPDFQLHIVQLDYKQCTCRKL